MATIISFGNGERLLIEDPSEAQEVTDDPRQQWHILVLSTSNGITTVKAERRYSDLGRKRELLIILLYLTVSSSQVERVESQVRETVNRLVEQFPDPPPTQRRSSTQRAESAD